VCVCARIYFCNYVCSVRECKSMDGLRRAKLVIGSGAVSKTCVCACMYVRAHVLTFLHGHARVMDATEMEG